MVGTKQIESESPKLSSPKVSQLIALFEHGKELTVKAPEHSRSKTKEPVRAFNRPDMSLADRYSKAVTKAQKNSHSGKWARSQSNSIVLTWESHSRRCGRTSQPGHSGS